MMSFNDSKIAGLIAKFWKEELTSGEEKELEQWLANSPENRQAFEYLMGHDVHALKNFGKNNPDRNKKYFDKAVQQTSEPGIKGSPVSKAAYWLFATAAAIVVCILLLPGRDHPAREQYIPVNENMVGLQLADGTVIHTDTIKNYLLIEQGIYQLLVHKNEIRYMPLAGRSFKKGQEGYNEIKIPARKMFTVILPDNSKIDLNALSSVRFPVTGPGSSIRSVELMGEGYFEVKPLYENFKKMPFVVTAKTQAGLSIDVTVKGTIFNINAYSESLIHATLLEGRIEVAANGERISLAAGEQLQVGAIIRRTDITSDDIINTVSWRDSCFSFKNAPITEVINEVNNWYGKKIELAEDVFRKKYTGRLFRSSDFDSILTAICRAIDCKPVIAGDRVQLVNN
jgi:transmembrane sensor